MHCCIKQCAVLSQSCGSSWLQKAALWQKDDDVYYGLNLRWSVYKEARHRNFKCFWSELELRHSRLEAHDVHPPVNGDLHDPPNHALTGLPSNVHLLQLAVCCSRAGCGHRRQGADQVCTDLQHAPRAALQAAPQVLALLRLDDVAAGRIEALERTEVPQVHD